MLSILCIKRTDGRTGVLATSMFLIPHGVCNPLMSMFVSHATTVVLFCSSSLPYGSRWGQLRWRDGSGLHLGSCNSHPMRQWGSAWSPRWCGRTACSPRSAHSLWPRNSPLPHSLAKPLTPAVILFLQRQETSDSEKDRWRAGDGMRQSDRQEEADMERDWVRVRLEVQVLCSDLKVMLAALSCFWSNGITQMVVNLIIVQSEATHCGSNHPGTSSELLSSSVCLSFPLSVAFIIIFSIESMSFLHCNH